MPSPDRSNGLAWRSGASCLAKSRGPRSARGNVKLLSDDGVLSLTKSRLFGLQFMFRSLARAVRVHIVRQQAPALWRKCSSTSSSMMLLNLRIGSCSFRIGYCECSLNMFQSNPRSCRHCVGIYSGCCWPNVLGYGKLILVLRKRAKVSSDSNVYTMCCVSDHVPASLQTTQRAMLIAIKHSTAPGTTQTAPARTAPPHPECATRRIADKTTTTPSYTRIIPAIQVRSGSGCQFLFLDPARRLRRPEPAARPIRQRMIKSEPACPSRPAALVRTMRGAIQLHDAARFCRRDGTLDPRIAAVQREGDL